MPKATPSSYSVQYFKPTAKLLMVLHTVGASHKLFTLKQVYDYIGQYINYKKLYNPDNMSEIICGNDILGHCLQKRFTIIDNSTVWKMLNRYLTPATKKEVSIHDPMGNQVEAPSPIEPNLPWWHYLETRSDIDDGTSDGEAHSYPEKATEVVSDSSYASERFSSSVNFTEYEPDEDSDLTGDTKSVSSIDFDEDENEDDSKVNSELIDVMDRYNDMHARKWACDEDDDSTTTDDEPPPPHFDPELSFEEYWQCKECPTRNKPTLGYCQSCWKLRDGWQDLYSRSHSSASSVPSTSRVRSLDVTDGAAAAARTRSRKRDKTTLTIVPKLPDFRLDDGAPPYKMRRFDVVRTTRDVAVQSERLTESQEITPSSCNHSQSSTIENDSQSSTIKNDSQSSTIMTNSQSSGCTASSESLPSAASEPAPPPSDGNSTTDLCNICHDEPKDAAMWHSGGFSHQYCCLRCARRLKRRDKPCPVCRKRILLVGRNYVI